MRTFLVVLSIWFLINILFAVVMIPPRKPRNSDQPRASRGLAPVSIRQRAHARDEDDRVSLRHAILAIAMGALLSLTPPLREAVEDVRRMIDKYRKRRQQAEAKTTSDSSKGS